MKRNFLWASNIALILTTTVPLRAADDAKVNTLTAAEKADGWKLLFNGRDLSGWHNFKREGVRPGWQVKDGALVLGSEDFNNRVAKSKFSKMPLFAKSNAGDIALQGDHGQVSFRNIKIRPIEAAK